MTTGAFTVQMATIRSDRSQRDAQFDGRIMDVATYPAGTFTLTRAISLAPVPATGKIQTYHATGNLTLHGHTRQVTFGLSAERTATQIRVSGSIPSRSPTGTYPTQASPGSSPRTITACWSSCSSSAGPNGHGQAGQPGLAGQPAKGASASASGARMPGLASSGRFMTARSAPASR